MSTPPYKSKLVPYRDFIADLRAQFPPVTYKEIARRLKEQFNLDVTINAIFSFVKVRSKPPPYIAMLPATTDIRNTIKTRIKEHKPTTTEQPKDPKWDFSE